MSGTSAGTLRHIQAHSDTFRHTQKHSGTLRHIQAHSGTFRHTQAHSGTLRHIQAHSETFRHTQAHLGTLRNTQTHSGLLSLLTVAMETRTVATDTHNTVHGVTTKCTALSKKLHVAS